MDPHRRGQQQTAEAPTTEPRTGAERLGAERLGTERLGTERLGTERLGTAATVDASDFPLARRLAVLMDDLVTIPGTRIGIGLDALVGLVPGVGDVLGSTVSGVVVVEAVRRRVPVSVLARMGWNLLLDALLGLVPTVGDVLDVAHRANRKNLRLLERAVAANPDPGPPGVGYVLSAVVLVGLPLLLAVTIGVVVIWFLISRLRG